MPNKTSLAALLIALCAVGACSNIETPDLDADVAREGIVPENWQPLPLRVGLAPFGKALQVQTAVVSEAESSNRKTIELGQDRLNRSEDSLHAQLIGALQRYEMFESIEEIRGAGPDTDELELQALALGQGLDLVIVPKVLRHDVAYVDSNSAYGWNMFVWWMVSPIISWFIADEDFEVMMHVQLQLYPVTGVREHFMLQKLQPPEKIVRSFDDFDEGFNLFSIYTTPRHFDESHWVRVGEKLMPIGDNEVKKAALRWVVNDLCRQAETEEFKASIRRRVALVIGVNGSGSGPVPLTRWAGADATAMRQHLLDAEHMGMAPGAVHELIDAEATRRDVENAAAAVAQLARENDDVILYFSGVGYVAPGGMPSLVLAQNVPGNVVYFRMDDLINLLLVNRPRTLTLMLDCSFTAPGDRRCATDADQLKRLAGEGVTNVLKRVIDLVENAGTQCIVLSASDGVIANAMPALEIEELGHGLFTNYALQALDGAANADQQPGVSTAEFEAWIGGQVARIARLEGMKQTGYYRVPEAFKDLALPSRVATVPRTAGAGGNE